MIHQYNRLGIAQQYIWRPPAHKINKFICDVHIYTLYSAELEPYHSNGHYKVVITVLYRSNEMSTTEYSSI